MFMLKLWNTSSRTIEEFQPIASKRIGMYACGPTVYQRAHIGNFRAYVFEDILRRVLEREGYGVTHVVNITDVGHLVGDVDEGVDKVEQAARSAGKTAWDIAREFADLFLVDLKRLGIELPTRMPKATDNIPEQIALIQELERKGFTYTTSDGVYFDTSKFPEYGSFSGQPLEEKEEGARVITNLEKRNSTDFALWKFSHPNGRSFDSAQDDIQTKRQMEWDSPWGVGFPGWHIECSAMSRKELGQPFDIHAGGVDHISVHHENEIAQSVAAYGAPLARYWFHVEFLLVDGQKMSKSLGNTYTLEDLEKKGFDPLSYRYFLLGAHYRQKQNFTWEALSAAKQALTKLRHAVRGWDEPKTGCADLEAEFFSALHADLNTPQALAVLWKTVDSEVPTSAKAETVRMMDHILGLGLSGIIAKPIPVPDAIRSLLDARASAREQKNWSESDQLRDEMVSLGWNVEDTSDGQRPHPAD
ncbi:cysteine--tRNA ligase [Candidatus Uhrbacteria bacterium]|nr:cysteine--tRNA ligase [Candidatus Uhrbacteria bacterium]